MKITKLLLVLSFLPIAAMSQEVEKNFKLGFTVSPNISWIPDNEGTAGGGASIGYSYGVLADLGFAKNYFFSTGFTLTTLNSSAEQVDLASEKYYLQYIDIPLSLKLKSNAGSSPRFYGQFGLGTGIKVSAKAKIQPFGQTGYSSKQDISSNVNIFRLGLLAGAGTEWNISRNLTVVTGVNFNNPFTKVFDSGESKNPYMTLQLGVFF
jgi:opacity protein-like surface antigen